MATKLYELNSTFINEQGLTVDENGNIFCNDTCVAWVADDSLDAAFAMLGATINRKFDAVHHRITAFEMQMVAKGHEKRITDLEQSRNAIYDDITTLRSEYEDHETAIQELNNNIEDKITDAINEYDFSDNRHIKRMIDDAVDACNFDDSIDERIARYDFDGHDSIEDMIDSAVETMFTCERGAEMIQDNIESWATNPDGKFKGVEQDINALEQCIGETDKIIKWHIENHEDSVAHAVSRMHFSLKCDVDHAHI